MLTETPEQFLHTLQKIHRFELFNKFRVFRQVIENPFLSDGNLLISLAKSLQSEIAPELIGFYAKMMHNLGNYQAFPLHFQACVLFTEKIPSALEEFVTVLVNLLSTKRVDNILVESLTMFKGKKYVRYIIQTVI